MNLEQPNDQSDEQEVGRDIEARARDMGWVPADEFKGDSSRWTDAETFVRRGEEILPILKSRLKKTEGRINELTETISSLREFHAEMSKKEVERKVAEATALLTRELEAARDAGDIGREVVAARKMNEVAAIEAKEMEKYSPSKPQDNQVPHKDVVSWKRANPWFGEDAKKTLRAQSLANLIELDNPELSPRELLDILDSQLKNPDGRGTTRVSGGGGSSNSSASRSGRGYFSLPPDAKSFCDKESAKYVGKGKPFATKEEWQDYFSLTYSGVQ